MPSQQSSAPFKRLGSEVAGAIGPALATKLLPYLRAFWPALAPSSVELRQSAGVDLIALDVDGGIDVAVACFGFAGSGGLETHHLPILLDAIARFQSASVTCRDYLIVHNLDGRNRDIEAQVARHANAMIADGNVVTVRNWHRTELLGEVEDRLRALIRERLHEQSELMLGQMSALFGAGSGFVNKVPVLDQQLRLRPGDPPVIEPSNPPVKVEPVADMLGAPGAHRWSLLTGLYGSGKTSTALHAAADRSHEVVYVHAGSIEPRRGENSTNIVMSRIIEELRLFGDQDDADRAILERLSGPLLRSLLSSEQSTETLIIDALDENRSLASPEAITAFASTLTELRCNVVLTTRQEHFRATFGNFDHLFEGLSWRGGGNRNIRLLELQPWLETQVIELLSAAIAEQPDAHALVQLRDEVTAGGTGGWDMEFLQHPFFLRMIMDLTLDGETPSGRRAEILARWSRRKLARDLRSARVTPLPVSDRDGFIHDVELLMENVAGEMTELDGNAVRLLDALPSSRLIELAEATFGIRRPELGAVLSVSLLVPAAVRFRQVVPVRFSHRAFHEFYLARKLHTEGYDGTPYPASVQAMLRELRIAPD